MTELWRKLLSSPVLRPTTPSVTSSLPPFDRVVDEEDDMSCDTGAPPLLDSVVHLHELPGSSTFAYAFFERDTGVADLETPSGHVVGNRRPTVPRCVHCDRVLWAPVLSSNGLFGHRFDLVLNGILQAHVEVFTDSAQIQRVAFVHTTYSLMARAAGTIDVNTLIEFNSPASHLSKLQSALTKGVGPLQLYLPTSEVVVGPALDAEFGAPLSPHPKHAKNPLACAAPAVWKRLRAEMAAISKLALEASQRHNAAELARSGTG